MINETFLADSTYIDSIEYDDALFKVIRDDLLATAKHFLPEREWSLVGGGPNATNENGLSVSSLLQHWSGYAARKPDEKDLFWWLESLRRIDHLGVVDRYELGTSPATSTGRLLSVSDLGIVWDINLCAAYLKGMMIHEPTIIEVGGGYGRLAEAFCKLYGKKVRYLLIDAVPASLMYAYRYLSVVLPSHRVGFCYKHDHLDFDEFDVFITTPWKLETTSAIDADLAINIQSMQEMTQSHVDYYLDLFDSVIERGGGLVYLCNRRDHIFRGEWKIPKEWRCLFKRMTPRSWIREFPAEMYQRTGGDNGLINELAEAAYQMDWQHIRSKKIQSALAQKYEVY